LPPKWRPAAVANCPNSEAIGRVTLSFLLFVAHFGTGPVSVKYSFMPRACAAATRLS
jgi:hypothetical protein